MPQPPEATGGGPARTARPVDLDVGSIALLSIAFVALVAVTGAVRSVPRTLASLAIATLLALALDPLVARVGRRLRVPRGGAVAIVVVAFLGVLTVVGLLLVPPAVRQARGLGADLPRVIEDVGDLPVIGDDLVRGGVPERLERLVADLPGRLAGDTTPIEDAARSLADGAVTAGITLLLALTLLVDGEVLLRAVRRTVPRRHRPRVESIGRLGYEVVGRYVAGSLLVATCAGLAVLIVGLLLGVPLTPLVAVWVALFNLVPQIGGAMGGIPFVLLGLTQGAGTGLACAAFFIVYLQLENNVLGPLLVGQAVKLSPPATMAAALVGVSAGGVVGALLAVPLVGAAKAVYLELRPAPTEVGDDTDGATDDAAAPTATPA